MRAVTTPSRANVKAIGVTNLRLCPVWCCSVSNTARCLASCTQFVNPSCKYLCLKNNGYLFLHIFHFLTNWKIKPSKFQRLLGHCSLIQVNFKNCFIFDKTEILKFNFYCTTPILTYVFGCVPRLHWRKAPQQRAFCSLSAVARPAIHTTH